MDNQWCNFSLLQAYTISMCPQCNYSHYRCLAVMFHFQWFAHGGLGKGCLCVCMHMLLQNTGRVMRLMRMDGDK